MLYYFWKVTTDRTELVEPAGEKDCWLSKQFFVIKFYLDQSVMDDQDDQIQ